MDVLRYTLLVLHFIGLAAIVGPFLDQWRADVKRVTAAMVWGARAQIVTGVLLVIVAVANDAPLDHAKIAIKCLVALAISGLAEVGYKKTRAALETGTSLAGLRNVWWLIGGLAIVNIIVAVFWH